MQKLILPLIIPTLLGGCTGFASRSPQPETPALVFVDGQISSSADVISQTQKRIAPPVLTSAKAPLSTVQTSLPRSAPLPMPVIQKNGPPASASASASAKGLVSDSSSPSILKTTSAPASGQVPTLPGITMIGTPGTNSVITLPSVRNLTLEQWIRRIIPSGWKLEYENALRTKLDTRIVSVPANDQWTRVLSRLLTEQSISGSIDWSSQTLTLHRIGVSVAAVSTQSAASTPPSASLSPAASKNPFSGQSAPSSLSGAVTPPSIVKPVVPAKQVQATPVLAPAGKPAVIGTPVAPVSNGKLWLLPAGTTLRENILKWASETRCESGASQNWTVIWPDSITDYRLDGPLKFNGTFESALSELFILYHSANTPLYAKGNRIQCLIEVSDKPANQ